MPDREVTWNHSLFSSGRAFSQVTDDICRPIEHRASLWWWGGLLLATGALGIGFAAVWYQLRTGIGTWGLNRTVGWAFDITNFVFWIGIGHAGTFISAILFLLRQKWRTSISRSAEAVTIFAVICAAIFPVIHMGRPWLAFWMFPYPNFRGPLWVNFRSPLVWDFFAIVTYFTISVLFWYLGLIPDLATMRDRAGPGLRKRVLQLLSLGWDASARTWLRYGTVYRILAGLATALVISVHTIVSWDFATSIVPGWHTTIFPPYFVIGAIFSGMAMVLSLSLMIRKFMHLESYITLRHVDSMCKILIFGSLFIGFAYLTEFFYAAYAGDPYEFFSYMNRLFGPLKWLFLAMLTCNVLLPQLLWSKRVRLNLIAVFLISVLINLGMWVERFVIIAGSLQRDFLPSSWAGYQPTSIEIATLIGSFGLFFTCFLLFCRIAPVIAISEVKHTFGSEEPE